MKQLENAPNFDQLFQTKIYIVGGAVRDALLQHPITEIDLCSELTPEQLIQKCQQLNIKYFGTGLNHGTISFRYKGELYEHTTFRYDVTCDGRNATIKYAKSLQEDIIRRDFTINALAYNNGKIYDYANGQRDLEKQLIRTVGNAKKRFQEDYLRIIRAARFSSRFNFSLDQELIDAAQELSPNILKFVSIERIRNEIDKSIGNINAFLEKALELNFFFHLFPLYKDDNFLELKNHCQYLTGNNTQSLLWLYIYYPIKKSISLKDFVHLFHLSNKTKLFINNFIKFSENIGSNKQLQIKDLYVLYQTFDCDIKDFIFFIKNNLKFDTQELTTLIKQYEQKIIQTIQNPLIKGEHLIELGFKPSKLFKNLLEFCHIQQILGKEKKTIMNEIKKKLDF